MTIASELNQTESPSAAPGDLELVRSFVNTLDIEEGADRLATPRGARGWLADRGHRLTRPPSAADLRRLVALREAIRDAAAGRGTPAEAAAIAALDRIAASHPITVRLSAAPLPFAAAGPGIDGFVERVLGIVAAATVDGTWERLKACPNDRCRWLFYDHSRNRSRTWCSMDVCGARSKMRAYRARRRAESAVARR
jgi:predicted RNA-binding Zn ribbon-like protein